MAKILIAEDHYPNRKLLCYRLGQLGHEVVAAENGHQALEQLANQFFDLAILDIWMPDLDGLNVLKQIRSSEQISSLPVIMLTASALDTHCATANDANLFLQKPISSQLLADTVNSLIE